MTVAVFYAIAGVALAGLGLFALFARAHLVRKILALNVLSSGVFMVFVALAYRAPGAAPDPVPHAMVLTGIVVSVSATAVALVLTSRLEAQTGRAYLGEDGDQGGDQ